MVGAGEGSLEKLTAAGVSVADLEALAIGRADSDHTGDLAVLLERAATERDRPLQIFGPDAGGAFSQLVDTARPDGASAFDVGLVPWRGLNSTWTIDTDAQVDAMNVPHGSWRDPSDQSVAYRVRVGDTTLVFGGDQNGTLGAFLDFADDAELLVMHLALSEQAEEALGEFHAWPSIVARVARQAAVDRLLVGQIVDAPMNHPTRSSFSGSVLPKSVREMQFTYSGPIDVASDLLCIPLD
jgi:ribonuclease BN (tRNA processing enzyme)